MVDDNLLVLKGGTTPDRDTYDDVWEPIDSYEAPYRKAYLFYYTPLPLSPTIIRERKKIIKGNINYFRNLYKTYKNIEKTDKTLIIKYQKTKYKKSVLYFNMHLDIREPVLPPPDFDPESLELGVGVPIHEIKEQRKTNFNTAPKENCQH